MVGDIVSHEGAEREDPTTVMFLLTVIVRKGLHNGNVLASGYFFINGKIVKPLSKTSQCFSFLFCFTNHVRK